MDTLINQVNADLYKLAERVLPGAGLVGYALPEGIRFVFAEGRGARLCDVEGHEYIDYVGGAGALILGHSHPAVVSAAQAQIARGIHMFGTLNDVAIRLAERLVHLTFRTSAWQFLVNYFSRAQTVGPPLLNQLFQSPTLSDPPLEVCHLLGFEPDGLGFATDFSRPLVVGSV